MNSLSFKINHSNFNDVFNHLDACKKDFVPRLDEYTSIKEYSEKILKKAERFEVWSNSELVGLIAVYFNLNKNSSFITSFSVKNDYIGSSLGKKLLLFFEDYITKKTTVKETSLEVYISNVRALKFYKKNGYKIINSSKNKYQLKKDINE